MRANNTSTQPFMPPAVCFDLQLVMSCGSRPGTVGSPTIQLRKLGGLNDRVLGPIIYTRRCSLERRHSCHRVGRGANVARKSPNRWLVTDPSTVRDSMRSITSQGSQGRIKPQRILELQNNPPLSAHTMLLFGKIQLPLPLQKTNNSLNCPM